MNWEFDDRSMSDGRKELLSIFSIVVVMVCIRAIMYYANKGASTGYIILIAAVIVLVIVIWVLAFIAINKKKVIVIRNGVILKGTKENRKYTMDDVKTCILTTKKLGGYSSASFTYVMTKIKLLDSNRKTIFITYVDERSVSLPMYEGIDLSSRYFEEIKDSRERHRFLDYLMNMDIEIIDKRTYTAQSIEDIDADLDELDDEERDVHIYNDDKKDRVEFFDVMIIIMVVIAVVYLAYSYYTLYL